MAEQPDDLKKLVAVATDLGLPVNVRTNTIKFIGNISTHEALLALLELAANEKLTRGERTLALKHAMGMVKAGR